MLNLDQDQCQKLWNDLLQGVEACSFILENVEIDSIEEERFKRYKKHLLQSMNMIYPTPEE